jgi:ATP-binding cassette subfamily B protein
VIDPARIRRVVALFQAKFPNLAEMKATDLSVFRINPSEIDYIDNEDGSAEEVGRAFGTGYRRRQVYSVFRELPEEEPEAIAGKLDTVQVESGATIVRQGAPADKFFIIIEGEVEVIREDNGVSRKVATLQRGQFFGEIAVLRDIPRTATVRAVAPTRLLTMDRDAFRTLVAQALGTTRDFDRVIQQRLEDLSGGGS